jgi:hypothetical protein
VNVYEAMAADTEIVEYQRGTWRQRAAGLIRHWDGAAWTVWMPGTAVGDRTGNLPARIVSFDDADATPESRGPIADAQAAVGAK